MTKSVRSPILGYNHNIQFHGQVFHVQTEDSGVQHARLFTHLFSGGTILASKKEEYDPTATEDAVRLLMQRLHKAMIKELKEGVHDQRILAFFKARGETITLGDKPALVAAPAAEPAGRAVAEMPAQPPPDDRPRPVSGSIDTPVQPMRAATATVPPGSKVTATPAPQPVAHTPQPITHTPTPSRKPVVVVKAPEVKRPPVMVAGSAEGVVVKRNVVINVGGGTPPVQGQISRGTAVPRPAVPYVVREGSYVAPTVSRGSGPHSASPTQPPPAPADGAAPPPSARDIRMPWEGPPGAAVEAARRGNTRPPSEHTPTGRAVAPDAAMRTRTPAAPAGERGFSADLPSDKSLDEVILEYLSDDAE
jgi:hypothetical protein